MHIVGTLSQFLVRHLYDISLLLFSDFISCLREAEFSTANQVRYSCHQFNKNQSLIHITLPLHSQNIYTTLKT